MKLRSIALSLALCMQGVAVQAAQLTLAGIFADHMVLQREKPVPVWGWADPAEEITVEFLGQKKNVRADQAGKWIVRLDPMSANSTPGTLTVRSAKGNEVTARDVLVGEVWLGSGQSNMAMGVGSAQDFEKEKASAELPIIRMFKVESGPASTAQTNAAGSWAVCSSETVGSFSATLYFFGRELHRDLRVPIGLINASVGGTAIESWIAADVQMRVPELKPSVQALLKQQSAFDTTAARAAHKKALADWEIQAEKAKLAGKPTPRKPLDPVMQRRLKGKVGELFNGKVAPVIPYGIRGAIWYQGEANGSLSKGALYQKQLTTLVTDWRKRWDELFPFAWVQLPNFIRDDEGWPLVRESMLRSLALPRTGMAITIDIGDPENVHPKNKQEVGRRLSLWALGEVYGRKVAATSGPLPTGQEIRGSQIILSFKHANGGLVARGGDLQGFRICSDDRQWKKAQAVVEGNRVIVTSADVSKPVAVRYAWEANPDCNLFNGAGLPASPFRTDTWPITTSSTSASPP